MYRSPYKPESGIRSFLMMPTEDFEEFDILPFLLEAIAFLSRAESSGGCAFVHCNYGVNRSGVVAAAYLMVSERKPLLQVINEIKARRSLILSNVGFRRQLVRFARCRGLLDPVERPSRRSPRLEPGDRSPRAVTPSKDTTTDETKDESRDPESTETNAVEETSGKNGEMIPPRNGYHVTLPAPSISTDLKPNGVPPNGILRPLQNTSRRERLLRDIDSTIENLAIRDDTDVSSTYYRPRDDFDWIPVTPSVPLYEQARSSTHFPVIDYTSPSVPVPVFGVLHHPYSSDSNDDFTPSSLAGDRRVTFYSPVEPSNAILDEYLKYKSSSTQSQFAKPAVLPVPVPPPAVPTTTVRPRSYYTRSSATGSSVIDDYDEANMSSFLAVRNARRPRPSPQGRLDHAITSFEPRRRSASSVDAIIGVPRSYSTSKASMSLGGGYKPSPEVGVLPLSAYIGRLYTGPTPSATGRRYPSTSSAAHYVMGMAEADVGDDPISGHGMRSAGRTIATRVTPAPGYGPRSSYARSHSVSRLM